ncbi:MAG: hypothetical protein ACK5N8_00040 [Alphaproteobacteria bacterium]
MIELDIFMFSSLYSNNPKIWGLSKKKGMNNKLKKIAYFNPVFNAFPHSSKFFLLYAVEVTKRVPCTRPLIVSIIKVTGVSPML